MKERCPVDPFWEILSVRPIEQEAPVILLDAEVFLATHPNCSDMARGSEFIENKLNGAAEVAGLAGDLGGVALLVGQQPCHNFGASLVFK